MPAWYVGRRSSIESNGVQIDGGIKGKFRFPISLPSKPLLIRPTVRMTLWTFITPPMARSPRFGRLPSGFPCRNTRPEAELLSVDPITISQQISRCCVERKGFEDLLRSPFGRRMNRDVKVGQRVVGHV